MCSPLRFAVLLLLVQQHVSDKVPLSVSLQKFSRLDAGSGMSAEDAEARDAKRRAPPSVGTLALLASAVHAFSGASGRGHGRRGAAVERRRVARRKDTSEAASTRSQPSSGSRMDSGPAGRTNLLPAFPSDARCYPLEKASSFFSSLIADILVSTLRSTDCKVPYRAMALLLSPCVFGTRMCGPH